MRRILLILTLFAGLYSYSQSEYKEGTLYSIQGSIIDEYDQSPLLFTLIEVFSKQERIQTTTTDFDGQFNFKICSESLTNDSLTLKVTAVNYHQKIYDCRIESDTIFTLSLKTDSTNLWTKEKVNQYSRTFTKECSTDEYNEAYEKNEYYRHCDGTIKKFREIETFNSTIWNLIKD